VLLHIHYRKTTENVNVFQQMNVHITTNQLNLLWGSAIRFPDLSGNLCMIGEVPFFFVVYFQAVGLSAVMENLIMLDSFQWEDLTPQPLVERPFREPPLIFQWRLLHHMVIQVLDILPMNRDSILLNESCYRLAAHY